MNAELDWADFELIDRIAEEGTLSAAARTLGVDQTTASRRLQRIEKRLGGALFDRIDGRLVATPLLGRGLANLRAMAELAAAARLSLARGRAELEGRVRVTSVAVLLTRLLAPALGSLRTRHPRVSVDLVADDRTASFERREADIAIRLARPEQDIALARRIGTLRFTLARLPVPAAPGPAMIGTAKAAANAPRPLVLYDDTLDWVPEMQAIRAARRDAPVALRANRLDILTEAAIAIGAEMMVPDIFLETDPRLAGATRFDVRAERELWLLVHPERRHVPAVAAVVDWIADVIGTAMP